MTSRREYEDATETERVRLKQRARVCRPSTVPDREKPGRRGREQHENFGLYANRIGVSASCSRSDERNTSNEIKFDYVEFSSLPEKRRCKSLPFNTSAESV